MSYFVRNNTTINYTSLGRGRPVVLIHGLGANQGFWGPRILLPLSRRFQVVLPDLRGHGRSSMPPTGYSPIDFAEDILGLLNRLHLQQVDLVGHSFGGVVALQCAVLAPERVRSLFLADTRVRSLEDPQTANALCESVIIRRRLEEVGLPIPSNEREAGLWLLEQFASPQSEQTRQELSRTEPFTPFHSRGGGSSRSARRWLELLRKTSLRDEFERNCRPSPKQLSALGQPIMAMCGESARTRHSLLVLADLLPQLRTALLDEAGHFFPLTHTALFLETLIGFLAEVKELRREERLPVNLGVQVFAGGTPLFAGTLINMSQGGLLVEGGDRLAVGTEVEVLLLPSRLQAVQPFSGTIVRQQAAINGLPPRFGIALKSGIVDWNREFMLPAASQGSGGPWP